MGRVAPTFGEPAAGDHWVVCTWGINGDTPQAIRIFRQPDNYGTDSFDAVVEVNTHVWENLPSGKRMKFYVGCVYPGGDVRIDGFYATTTGRPEPPPAPLPAPVTGLLADVVDWRGIQLAWDQITDRATTRVELRRDGPDGHRLIREFVAGAGGSGLPTMWTDNAEVRPLTEYRYFLRCFDALGRHVDSNVLRVTTTAPPPAPLPGGTLTTDRAQTARSVELGRSRRRYERQPSSISPSPRHLRELGRGHGLGLPASARGWHGPRQAPRLEDERRGSPWRTAASPPMG